MNTTDTKSTRTLSTTRDAIRKRNKRYLESVKRENEAFAAMTPAQQRVAIAKDVLKWIALDRLVPTTGSYFDVWNKAALGIGSNAYYRKKLDGQEALLKPEVKCSVCALGGLFACTVARANSITLYDVNIAGQGAMHEYLAPYFDRRQLLLVESAFERVDFRPHREKYRIDDYGDESFVQDLEVERAVAFGCGYDKADKRMRAIMENIIANGGEFKP